MTPTARSLGVLREMGYTVDVVERWVPGAKVRRDLGGFGDVLAWHPEHGFLAVQCTTGSHHAARVKKARVEPRLRTWLQAGGRFQVWSWRLAGKRGERKRWTLRTEPVTPADLRSEIEGRRPVEPPADL